MFDLLSDFTALMIAPNKALPLRMVEMQYEELVADQEGGVGDPELGEIRRAGAGGRAAGDGEREQQGGGG